MSTRRERGGEWRVLRAVSAAEPRAAVGGTVSRRATFSLVDQESARAAAFLLLHVPVALIAASSRDAATAHAVLTLVVGAWWATASNRTERVAWVAAYIASAEVLWRMTQAQVYWEFGKYAASAIFLLSLMRSRTLKPPLFPLLYFVLLLPSVALTLTGESLDVARDQISFNLSGPFALFLSAWFFSAARFPAFAALRTMFVAFLGPAVAIATLAARGSFSSDVIFSTQSNLAASGGFGPNQVSAALGLGALLALFIVLDSRSRQEMRALMTLALLWLAAQSALTFSRAGLYMAAGGAGLAACFAMRDARLRSRLIPIVLVVAAVGNYFVVPYLEAFTEGAITQRFQDVYLTGRDRMIRADMELFQQNPILGVGPGEARVYRARTALADLAAGNRRAPTVVAAHTEFSRLAAEHGVLGLAALALLFMAAVRNVKRLSSARTRALIVGLIAWSLLFMLGDGMRLLAPSLFIGVSFALSLPEGEDAPDEPRGPAARRWFRRRADPRRLTDGHPALAFKAQ